MIKFDQVDKNLNLVFINTQTSIKYQE